MSEPEDIESLRTRLIGVLSAYVVQIVGVAAILYASPHYWKQEYHTSALSGIAWVKELVVGPTFVLERCSFRMLRNICIPTVLGMNCDVAAQVIIPGPSRDFLELLYDAIDLLKLQRMYPVLRNGMIWEKNSQNTT
jgi:hypothetical protein